jgi:hypothetical protein
MYMMTLKLEESAMCGAQMVAHGFSHSKAIKQK